MRGTYNEPNGVGYLQRDRKSNILRMLKETRFDIFSLKQTLLSNSENFDPDDAISPFDEKLKFSKENHDLTREAKDIGLKLIAGHLYNLIINSSNLFY